MYSHFFLFTNTSSSSSSSCRATNTDIPDPLSPLFPIVHRHWQVFSAKYIFIYLFVYNCKNLKNILR